MEFNLEEENKKIQEATDKGQDPFDVAATMHGLYKFKFEQMIQELSTGQLRRLANALVQYPLNDKEFIDDSQNLKNCFYIGQSLLEAKMMMTLHTLSEHEKTLEKNSNIEEAVIVKETNEKTE